FDIAKAQRKPIIKPHGMGDNLGWKTVTVITGKRFFDHDAQNITSISRTR
ncbi:hypothetical protein GGE17_007686, partial [Rhizobium leguminosarum]|nr:hypothetical protein [Rhizobium leguminosarum]